MNARAFLAGHGHQCDDPLAPAFSVPFGAFIGTLLLCAAAVAVYLAVRAIG